MLIKRTFTIDKCNYFIYNSFVFVLNRNKSYLKAGLLRVCYLCYNQKMKKETQKELGKYLLDVSKILVALALITPLLKDESVSLISVALFTILLIAGTYLTNKGAKEDE